MARYEGEGGGHGLVMEGIHCSVLCFDGRFWEFGIALGIAWRKDTTTLVLDYLEIG